ncbi:MAG: hypothetical protein IOD12_00130 [Silvanigrellales bacterium]|nr:hypothetical protein [Silvanigrellales bacterium]
MPMAPRRLTPKWNLRCFAPCAAMAVALFGACSHAAPSTDTPLATPRNTELRAPVGPFRYNESTGACLNAQGQAGRNPLPASDILKVGARAKPGVDLECTDVTALDLNAVFGPSYKTLPEWNLRGALFGNTPLRFVKFQNPDLRGARMEQTLLQYSEIGAAQIDAFTKLPSNCPKADASASTGPYGCRR